jgi:SWI/SNF related-matrix-associated actin-dependent regulator of chromatin subfamily C
MEVRRNVFDSNGKEIKTDKEKSGESPAPNGAASTGEGAVKSIEEGLKTPAKQFSCYICGTDCTRVRYHNSKSAPHSSQGKTAAMAKYDICPNCYQEGKFPGNTNSRDYTKLENDSYNMVPDRDLPWTDSEVLLLLEGLELFDEDWNAVSDHVASRTREECVLKFLQLGIEDPYLEAEHAGKSEQTNGAVNGAQGGQLAWLSNGRVPFSAPENPVMSVLGFLASSTDPQAAAAAAGKSVKQISMNMRKKLEKGSDASKDKDQPTEVKNEDSMEVDTDGPAADPATAAFAMAAGKAGSLASHEERNITRLVSACVNMQLEKLNLKLAHFSEMEALLQAERRDVERRRQQLFLDRLAFQRRVSRLEDSIRQGLQIGGDEGLKVVKEGLQNQTGGQGEKMGVQRVNADGGEVKPLGSDTPGYRSVQI